MVPLRVLVVDDAVTMRRLVREAFADDPELQIAGEARTGREALERIAALHPDAVVLDLEMPVMNGLETLVALRRDHARLPVIVFSAATRHGAAATIEALWLGANDCVAKTATGGTREAIHQLRSELAPRIKALCARSRTPARPAARHAAPTVVPVAPALPRPTEPAALVAIGASTGGPAALAVLLAGLPADCAAPVLVVQHMPAAFTAHLAESLGRRTELNVREAGDGMALAAGRVYFAPGDQHMTVEGTPGAFTIRLVRGPHEHACRPALDPLLRSVALACGPRALAVVLTGMGRDGLEGCTRVREAGGRVLVQDEATSIVWGMPGRVWGAGLADAALAPAELALEIRRRTRAAGRRAAA